jgi:hypothetical protein
VKTTFSLPCPSRSFTRIKVLTIIQSVAKTAVTLRRLATTMVVGVAVVVAVAVVEAVMVAEAEAEEVAMVAEAEAEEVAMEAEAEAGVGRVMPFKKVIVTVARLAASLIKRSFKLFSLVKF